MRLSRQITSSLSIAQDFLSTIKHFLLGKPFRRQKVLSYQHSRYRSRNNKQPLSIFFIVFGISFLASCQTSIRPETRTLANEIADSTSALMRITDDSEFFRRYIAFNVRFTLRHQLLLNDTVIRKELQQEISKTALVQEAQKRVNTIQNSLR